jgi:hypothetical protein
MLHKTTIVVFNVLLIKDYYTQLVEVLFLLFGYFAYKYFSKRAVIFIKMCP